MKRGTIIIEPARIAVALSSDGTVWMTTEEIATIFHTTAANIERCIAKLLMKGELDGHNVRTEEIKKCGKKWYIVEYYNLDMIIALCFRVDTPSSKAFRQWITKQVVRSLKREPMQPLILRIESRNETAN